MCEHGTTIDVDVTVVADLAHEGVDTVKAKPIDACVAPIVAALEAAGIRMLGSCCGHGDGDGWIALADGRQLIVNAVGERLRLLRVTNGLKLREVAAAAGMHPRDLSDIEHARVGPTETQVTKIREAVASCGGAAGGNQPTPDRSRHEQRTGTRHEVIE